MCNFFMAKILAIGAHPDDIEYYAGGTLAKMANQGHEVVFVVATDGRNGTTEEQKAASLIRLRKGEQKISAQIIGAKKVIHLNHKDGTLEESVKKLKQDLLKILTEEQPEIVFTFDPQKQYIIHDDFHPDHRTLAVAALDIILIDSTLPAKTKTLLKKPDIFLYNSHQVNERIDITNFLAQKKAALESFKSQASRLKLPDIGFEEFQVY